jgi:transcription-repair coupling factor (superfamily II helicase)
MRASIDVLAMSATPIPRTLHMSLVGLRDMSVIETPPKDRMAIQTIVAKFDEKLIRTAIEVELERGGQVYFVHNRVETIYEIASKIRELVPQARVVVGHGQLPEAELESTMLAFMDGEFDVLVATSIIENGLDIPRANTIIINRADRHGLSELYQLRGRVGRSNRRAYAYLLIPPEQQLTEIARRRLAALKEFSDLGAGFKIAALDLELRGAGNMLGGEQSGHIEAIGFEMYTTMLEEAVSKLKGEGREERPSVTVNLGISLRIDEQYIPEEGQRLRMYKRIAGAETDAALTEVRAELEDRYGKPPENVLHLLAAAEIRLTCELLGIAQIERKRTAIDEPKKPTSNQPQRPGAPSVTASPSRVGQPPPPARPTFGTWGTRASAPPAPLPGRYGQALTRPESNATRALRETAAVRPANTPAAQIASQAGKLKPMRDMLYITFSEKLHAAPAEGTQNGTQTISPGLLMKIVARHAKQGAQLTPQGVLKWPLTAADANTVLSETRDLLAQLRP